jgi:sulfite exporter TauE/SafE/copper chaperone CopZ
MEVFKFRVDGMTCHSCELHVEAELSKLPGVTRVDVNVTKGVARIVCDGPVPSLKAINAVLKGCDYRACGLDSAPVVLTPRPKFLQLVWLFGAALAVALAFGRLVPSGAAARLGAASSFGSAFALGLVASLTSCLAVVGGLLLAVAAKARERLGEGASASARLVPTASFIAGRIISYGLLGGVLGLIGRVLLPSPAVTGALIVLAALMMLSAGLGILGLVPRWLKAALPRWPKALSRGVFAADSWSHPLAPFLLGAATFFVPCGFTQSLQVYALTTGSFVRSALLLVAFALGTAPALLTLGWASASFKGRFGRWFLWFAGALVVILGLWNLKGGLTLLGFRLEWPRPAATSAALAADPNVKLENGVQVIHLRLGSAALAYEPSDSYNVKVGVPVRLEIEGPGTGCRSRLVIPRLGLGVDLNQALNVLEFTPKDPGTYDFTCSMGMYPGRINVMP